MKHWKAIANAPRDGRLVRVKRVVSRSTVFEGVAYFGDITIYYGDDADPLLRYQTYKRVWVAEGGTHLFPAPTHFLPEPGDDQMSQADADAPPKRPEFTGPERDELGIRMLCAWNNIPRSMAHPDWSLHANASTREAWARVAQAAIDFNQEAILAGAK